jgi:hypothetical protein
MIAELYIPQHSIEIDAVKLAIDYFSWVKAAGFRLLPCPSS